MTKITLMQCLAPNGNVVFKGKTERDRCILTHCTSKHSLTKAELDSCKPTFELHDVQFQISKVKEK